MLDVYDRDFTTLVFNQQFIVPTSGQYPDGLHRPILLGLTPDTASADTVCPDVLNVLSWAKQTSNILTQEQHFLPELKHWVSMLSIG